MGTKWMKNILIRPEQIDDYSIIKDQTRRAFAPMPFADENDQEITDGLRNAGALTLSLVATLENKVVGHVAVSSVTHESGAANWFGIGPISVAPDLQRQGIGKLLMRQALETMKAKGAAGMVLVGDTNYYPKFGFALAPAYCPEKEPPEHFMLLAWSDIPQGRFAFHPVFYRG